MYQQIFPTSLHIHTKYLANVFFWKSISLNVCVLFLEIFFIYVPYLHVRANIFVFLEIAQLYSVAKYSTFNLRWICCFVVMRFNPYTYKKYTCVCVRLL